MPFNQAGGARSAVKEKRNSKTRDICFAATLCLLVTALTVSGQMAVSDSLSLALSAGAGLYDNSNQRLTVKDKVSLTSDTFALALDAADIDFRDGAMRSLGPVLVTRQDGSQIRADSFAAADNGRQLTFLGHVRTTIQPANSAAMEGKP